MSTSPFDAYATWFEALPPELANELAAALMQFFPGELLTSTLSTPSPTDGLLPRMRRLAATPSKEVGLVSTLVALTELVLTERATPEHVNRTEHMLDVLESVGESATGSEEVDVALNEWIAHQQLQQPLRARQWAQQTAQWRSLAEGPLSKDELLEFLRVGALGL